MNQSDPKPEPPEVASIYPNCSPSREELEEDENRRHVGRTGKGHPDSQGPLCQAPGAVLVNVVSGQLRI